MTQMQKHTKMQKMQKTLPNSNEEFLQNQKKRK